MQENKKNMKSIVKRASSFMPNTKEAQVMLRARAERLALHELERTEKSDETTYIKFRLNKNDFYGIPYQHSREVMRNVTLTRLPCSPPFVAGVINRRGALIAVIDLKKLFQTPLSDYSKDAYILVVTAKGITMGILADHIEGSDTYDAATLGSPISIESAIKPEYIIGLHHGVTAVINIENVIESTHQHIKTLLLV